MTKTEALALAERIAAGRCDVTTHQGWTRKDQAIQLSGAFLRDIEEVAREIRAALPGGKYVHNGSFAAVWYDA